MSRLERGRRAKFAKLAVISGSEHRDLLGNPQTLDPASIDHGGRLTVGRAEDRNWLGEVFQPVPQLGFLTRSGLEDVGLMAGLLEMISKADISFLGEGGIDVPDNSEI